MQNILGIDVGATAIKGAIVDLEKGILVSEVSKIYTPESKMPEDIAGVIAQMVGDFGFNKRSIGIGFPAVIRNRRTLTASNIDASWINYPIFELLENYIDTEFNIINDADAAGLAEMKFGAGINSMGTVILLTLGTGIGSAIFKDGMLLSNTELGRMIYKESYAEHYASNAARKKYEMDWKTYGKALNNYLEYVCSILSPDKIILGGGISKVFEEYAAELNLESMHVVPAKMHNDAGIVGAAYSIRLK
jgi:polyphosphate glucokinase